MIGSKVFWNKSAIKYAKAAIKDIKTYQKKLSITQQYLNKESEVLEFGCGTGGTAIIHAPFVKKIVATDISEKMIEIAKNKAIECNVKNVIFRENTLDELILYNQDYDVILGLNVIHLLEDVDNSINYIYKLLKNNGVFISSTSLIGEVNLVFRLLLSLMQFIGLAPYVSVLTKNQFISKLNKAGFTVEFEWQTSSESIFIVAKK